MMQLSNKAVINCAAILWITVNVWISMPYADNTAFILIFHLVIVIINPILFGLIAWYGTLNKMLSMLFYAAIVVLTWIISPAIFSTFKWGSNTFFRFLLDKRSIGFWIYLFVCIAIYCFAAALAKKRLQKN